jgi:hypothetical protein
MPDTRMMATRYGRGRNRLKASTSGSTAGSPSIVKVYERYHVQDISKKYLDKVTQIGLEICMYDENAMLSFR